MISKDTETTGLDIRHGAKPFFITTSTEEGEQAFWEADVDPLTRLPQWKLTDIIEIQAYCSKHDEWIYQNSKFDIAAERSIGIKHPLDLYSRIRDTLLAAHLLNSGQPHDLTTLALEHLGVDIQPYEDRLKEATKQARSLVQLKAHQAKFSEWRIAKKDLEEMPSAKGKMWKFDSWLPRAVAKELNYPNDHPWWTALRDYSNVDSEVTVAIYKIQLQMMMEQDLLEIYEQRLKILPVVYAMEDRGITLSMSRMIEQQRDYEEESERLGRVCINIAKENDYDLELPKSGNNKSLTNFIFNGLKLPPLERSAKTNEPSLNGTVMEQYQATLQPRSKPLAFINALMGKRKRDTALSYMEGYKRYWLPWGKEPGWCVLHPSLNSTGTNTLRFSSQSPNEQNISKKEGFNLRYMFGPAPGREWWSLDAKNIELRIPAYEAEETAMIELFERPNDPPYFGSNHLLFFDILHPEKFAKYGAEVKNVFKSTWYQWTKNGNFAVQYGAQEESGTADRAYHVVGAQAKIQKRLGNIAKLNQYQIAFANKHGYVETMPDKRFKSKRGYPLYCTRTKWGRIKPTVPLSYHVQGTAMWWMCSAMARVQDYLDKMNATLPKPLFFLVLQVHDELVLDFPYWKDKGNLPIVNCVKKLMESGGEDIGVPTEVGIEYHPENWSEGEVIQ